MYLRNKIHIECLGRFCNPRLWVVRAALLAELGEVWGDGGAEMCKCQGVGAHLSIRESIEGFPSGFPLQWSCRSRAASEHGYGVTLHGCKTLGLLCPLLVLV